MSRSRYRIFDQTFPHFVTCTIVGWLPVFTRPDAVQIVLDSLAFLRRQGRLAIYGYVVMENHLHMVVASLQLGKELGDFKSFTARKIIDLLQSRKEHDFLRLLGQLKATHKLDRRYQLWQEGSHPQQITGPEMMRQKLSYMHHNPLKRGYVDEAVHWRYSSARNYEGGEPLIDIDTDWEG